MSSIKEVGEVVSTSTFISYMVEYNKDERTAWISRNKGSWILVCEKVPDAESVLICVRQFIQRQPKLY